jgi:hypothetical protein
MYFYNVYSVKEFFIASKKIFDFSKIFLRYKEFDLNIKKNFLLSNVFKFFKLDFPIFIMSDFLLILLKLVKIKKKYYLKKTKKNWKINFTNFIFYFKKIINMNGKKKIFFFFFLKFLKNFLFYRNRIKKKNFFMPFKTKFLIIKKLYKTFFYKKKNVFLNLRKFSSYKIENFEKNVIENFLFYNFELFNFLLSNNFNQIYNYFRKENFKNIEKHFSLKNKINKLKIEITSDYFYNFILKTYLNELFWSDLKKNNFLETFLINNYFLLKKNFYFHLNGKNKKAELKKGKFFKKKIKKKKNLNFFNLKKKKRYQKFKLVFEKVFLLNIGTFFYSKAFPFRNFFKKNIKFLSNEKIFDLFLIFFRLMKSNDRKYLNYFLFFLNFQFKKKKEVFRNYFVCLLFLFFKIFFSSYNDNQFDPAKNLFFDKYMIVYNFLNFFENQLIFSSKNNKVIKIITIFLLNRINEFFSLKKEFFIKIMNISKIKSNFIFIFFKRNITHAGIFKLLSNFQKLFLIDWDDFFLNFFLIYLKNYLNFQYIYFYENIHLFCFNNKKLNEKNFFKSCYYKEIKSGNQFSLKMFLKIKRLSLFLNKIYFLKKFII